MLSDSTVLDLIGRIYDGAADPHRWPAFLEAVADQVRGKNTILIQYDLQSMAGSLVTGVRTDPDVVQRYNEYYHAKDVWARAAGARLRSDYICVADEYCPAERLVITEFYNDFLAPQDVLHLCYANVRVDGNWSICLSTLRSARQEHFGSKDLSLMRALAPHLRRAFQWQRRMAGLENAQAATAEAMDRLPYGIIFVDRAGRVCTANRAAVEILDQNDGLRLYQGVLTAAGDGQRRELLRIIASAAATATGNGFEAGGALALRRPSLRRPLALLVVPVRSDPLLDERGATVVFVSDPEKRQGTNQEVLCRLLSLTRAEARLAAILMQGSSLEHAADQLHISRNTIRWQLQKIFEKTGTQRQGELVRLLFSTVAGLRVGD